ncbi:MAG: RDD family protein [Helicobacter sp.]|uniref:RDD family protein n=1 Tax=Helicobacter sp. TaxID=218 RepID=UPI0023C31F13|nr:RDD family protein [Helicobacter sp.]MDE7174906.1 RDD family protein [Helicobacter sp.]
MRWRKVKQNPKSPTQAKHKTDSALPPTNALPHQLIQELAQNPSDSLQTASFWDRGKAQVIDTFMIYLPLLYFLTYVVIGSAQGFRDSSWAPFSGVLIYGILVALLLAFKGQTPGKKAYNLWIVRENGKNVTFPFALLRFIAFLLSGVSVVGIFMPLWRKDKKALHDILLKTIVLKKG